MVKLYKRIGRNLVSAGDWHDDSIEPQALVDRQYTEISGLRDKLKQRSAELVEAQNMAIAARCQAEALSEQYGMMKKDRDFWLRQHGNLLVADALRPAPVVPGAWSISDTLAAALLFSIVFATVLLL